MLKRKLLFVITTLIIGIFLLFIVVNFFYVQKTTLEEILKSDTVVITYYLDFSPEDRGMILDPDYEEENMKILQNIFENNLDMPVKLKSTFFKYRGKKADEAYYLSLNDERIYIYENMLQITNRGKFDRIALVDDNSLFEAIKKSNLKWRYR